MNTSVSLFAASAPGIAARSHARPLADAPASAALARLEKAAQRKAAGPGGVAPEAEKIGRAFRDAKAEGRAQTKARAAATVERLTKLLKLVKEIWANNPKEMARQLAKIAADLKAAVKDYAKAAEGNADGLGAPAPIVPPGPMLAPQAPGKDVEASAKPSSEAESETAPETAPGPDFPEKGLPPRASGEAASAMSAYARAAEAERKRLTDAVEGETRGDQEFYKQVRDFVKKLREELDTAKIKAAFMPQRFEKSEEYKDAVKAMTEVDEALEESEKAAASTLREIGRASPAVA